MANKNDEFSSSSSLSDDDWDTAGDDLVVVVPVSTSVADKKQDDDNVAHEHVDNDNDGWAVQLSENDKNNGTIVPKKDNNTVGEQDEEAATTGEPMIIVDMTMLDPSIHNRFDQNSVNDPEKASQLRKQIESSYASYEKYAKNAELLANGTVIPCGSSVYRPALIQLRRAKPGHYYCAIFPPTKKAKF
jgi:hypothetical protein